MFTPEWLVENRWWVFLGLVVLALLVVGFVVIVGKEREDEGLDDLEVKLKDGL